MKGVNIYASSEPDQASYSDPNEGSFFTRFYTAEIDEKQKFINGELVQSFYTDFGQNPFFLAETG